MKALVIHAARNLRLEECPETEPGPGEVALQVALGGICGSDLHYYNHGGFGAIHLREPMILGHEVSARVTALGAGVKGLTVGDLVAVSPSRPCGICDWCRGGMQNHCPEMRFYGSAMRFPHVQGAFRQVLVADAAQCVRAEGLTPAEAAMSEPLAVALHAVGRAGQVRGKRVLVTGCGPIGSLCILAARHAGAAEIVATDLSDFTLGLAGKVGADQMVNMHRDPEGLAPFAGGKGSFDVLFECSGAAAALAAAIPAMRPRGIVVQLGLGGDMTLPMQALTAKELDLRGTFRFHAEFAESVALMQAGQVDVRPLITHTVGLDRAEEGFRLAHDRLRAVKVQITFG
jgi:L-idonate 5-dehydrogenase